MIKNLLEKSKRHFSEVLTVQTSPHSIALGFAVGTFISIIPTPGFNILLGLLAVFIYPKLNKVALFGAFLVWNPLLSVPVYTFSYKIGQALFGPMPVIRYELTLWNHAYHFTRRIIIGSLILGFITAMISYGVVRVSAQKYQERQNKKD